MYGRTSHWGEVDDEGRLIFPPEMVAYLGLRPGNKFRIDHENNRIQLHRPVTHLTKIYVEPTDQCNLACRTCIRNSWNEKLGRMSEQTFSSILNSIGHLDPLPTLFFGGLGEPLFHKQTMAWISRAKELGTRVELITNGTMSASERSNEANFHNLRCLGATTCNENG